ncbi:MAG: PIG-L deacetylase family protein [Tepidiformaceae bacterium]
MPKLLVITPHPDDEAYTAGGLISLATAAGWDAVLCCATRGERGERFDGGPLDPQALAVTREAELRAACDVLGIGTLEIWRFPDGGLADEIVELRHLSVDAVGRHHPDFVVTMGADGVYGHPDHLAINQAVRASWMMLPASRLCPLIFFAFPPGLFVPQVERCRAAGVISGDAPSPGIPDPHYTLSIAAVREQKLKAIAAHRSQLPGGDPHALFPGGIVDRILETESYHDAEGDPDPAVTALFATF